LKSNDDDARLDKRKELKKIFKIEEQEWVEGDLVKISSFRDGARARVGYGLVSSAFYNEKQINIFPMVSVYNMSTQKIERHYVRDLELISKSDA